MNLIYIGSYCPDDIVERLRQKGSRVNFASNTLQSALLDGFISHNRDLKIITAWSISAYPRLKPMLIKRTKSIYKNLVEVVHVGVLNLPIINLVSKFLRVRKEIKARLKHNEDNNIIVYEVHSPFLLAVVSLRKKFSKSCLIVPDLPEFMSGNQGFVHKILKKIDGCLINWALKRIDTFALLSEPMKDKLQIGNSPWILMEGIYASDNEGSVVEKEELRTIMYTGNIYKRRGVDILLEAFEKIDKPNYRLWIRGEGEMRDEIIAMSKKDARIKYFPAMSRVELLELERRATVMVNSTPPSDFTNYFFPSKTMEYLASGTPTIMFKLGCMPEEYAPYVYYVEENSVECLKNKLIEICEKPQTELNEFGLKARKFILSNKTPYLQCSKIMKLIEGLRDG